MIETFVVLMISLLCIGLIFLIMTGILVLLFLYYKDKKQEQSSVLRNHPLLARVRYIAEKISPEIKDYFGDKKQPISKDDYVALVKSSKYISTMTSFGTEKDYDIGGYFLKNAMFPVRDEDMKMDREVDKANTRKYIIDKEGLFSRKEHMEDTIHERHLLADEDVIVLGSKTCRYPFVLKGQVGMSAMSYGSLGENAISALGQGIYISGGEHGGGSWMNTGEGGVSNYHLESGADLIVQIGPAKFGFRTKDGDFDWDELKRKSMFPQVKAFEIKLAQGAKVMGGRIDGAKVTPSVAEIRGVEPWKDINSPKRFDEFTNEEEMLGFIDKIRKVTGKPVGIKIVMGGEDSIDKLIEVMDGTNIIVDFITVDSSSGGSGKAPRSHMQALGTEIKTAIPIVDRKLKEAGLREDIKLIASGKLINAESIAVALALGSDLINTGRGFLVTIGCILALDCASGRCVTGVATTDSKLQRALVVDEKKYRVANYILSLREELYSLASACGIDSPVKFSKEHLTYVGSNGKVVDIDDYKKTQMD